MSILQKNKKAAAGIGVVAAAAAVLALGAGTYAAFIDTENAQATFAAGTLDLTVGATGEAGQLDFANVSPGWTATHTVPVGNGGTVDGILKFNVQVTGSDNGCTEPEQEANGCSGDGDLAENVTVEVPGLGTFTLGAINGQGMQGIPLNAGSSQDVTFNFAIADTVGNEIQSDTAAVTIVATLEQADS